MKPMETPFICSKCGENLLHTGVTCQGCTALLCPHCDCALSVDHYCYCSDCGHMVANEYASFHGKNINTK